ncbi:hypothetical protein BRADI_1g36455v3 [Brachypodium distachyon]|uniref:Uncharacterized protein n=1 Tax=Brachypodium distachyon TaxID=15368 RepID=A0A2K2DN06_BRADI|nr:hypothetical protein BRADI_1g36455v3 [Brachypodium distachyon]
MGCPHDRTCPTRAQSQPHRNGRRPFSHFLAAISLSSPSPCYLSRAMPRGTAHAAAVLRAPAAAPRAVAAAAQVRRRTTPASYTAASSSRPRRHGRRIQQDTRGLRRVGAARGAAVQPHAWALRFDICSAELWSFHWKQVPHASASYGKTSLDLRCQVASVLHLVSTGAVAAVHAVKGEGDGEEREKAEEKKEKVKKKSFG